MPQLVNQISVEKLRNLIEFSKSLLFKRTETANEKEVEKSLILSSTYMVAKLKLYKETPEYRALGNINVNDIYQPTSFFNETVAQIEYNQDQEEFCKEFEWNSMVIYENVNKIPIEERIGYNSLDQSYLFDDEFSFAMSGEWNPYYSDLFYKLYKTKFNTRQSFFSSLNKESISRFDLATARLSEDYKIIYYDNSLLDNNIINSFLTNYNFHRNYFLSTNYEKSYEWSPKYHNFVELFLVFCAMKEILTDEMKNAFLVELMDNYNLTNYLYSFGITFMDNANKSTKKKLLKNLSYLFNNKGTDKIFTTILSIFGFDNVQIFKYYVVNNNKDVHFLRVPYLERDINNAIYNENTTRVEFDKVINEDERWDKVECSKEVLREKDFNIIQSKYYDIESAVNMAKEIGKLACFYNVLHDIHLNNNLPIVSILARTIENIGPTDIRLFDAMLGLQLITLKFASLNKYQGAIPWDQSEYYVSPPTNLDEYFSLHNFKNEDDLNSTDFTLNEKIIDASDTYNRNILSSAAKILDDYYKDYKEKYLGLSTVKTESFATSTEEEKFSEYFDGNLDLKEKLENDIYNIRYSYEDFKRLKSFYDYLFYTDRNQNIFVNESNQEYTSYIDFLTDRNAEFGEYINNVVNTNYDLSDEIILAQAKRDVLEAFDNLASAIQITVSSKNIRPEFYIPDTIINYVNDLINYFKSYTIELRRMSIYYSFDSKLDNLLKLMDSRSVNTKTIKKADNIFGQEVIMNQNGNTYQILDSKEKIFIYKNDKLVYEENENV